MTQNNHTRGGFTLIETLIYVALFALVIGGGTMTAFQLIQSSGNTEEAATIESEGNFLMRKLDWATTGSQITLPISGATSTSLSLSRGGATYVFAFSGGTITLSQNGAPAVPLTTQNVTPSNVIFQHIPSSAISGEGIQFSFLLNGKQFGPKVRSLR